MRNLTATICLTLAVLFGSAGMSWSADLKKGLTAYESGDYATALREWKPLAEQGDPNARHILGLLYYEGQGVPQDFKEAVRWFLLAAGQGLANAQFKLGNMYEQGQGVPQDFKEAVTWYRLAAEQGLADAQSSLGLMYDKGKGVAQDYRQAAKWYTLAAKQGNGGAQNNLGVMYVKGHGVVQDTVYAYMWWNIAASSGDKLASKNRDIIAEGMTPALMAVAQKMARECLASNYKKCDQQAVASPLPLSLQNTGEPKKINQHLPPPQSLREFMVGYLGGVIGQSLGFEIWIAVFVVLCLAKNPAQIALWSLLTGLAVGFFRLAIFSSLAIPKDLTRPTLIACGAIFIWSVLGFYALRIIRRYTS
jgi:TPR repeat protein